MKRLLPVLLCIFLLLGSLPFAAFAAETEDASTGAAADEIAPTGYKLRTEAEFQAKLAAARAKYVHGSIWEGVYYEDGYAKAWTCWAYACQIMREVFDAQFYNEGLYSKYKSYDMSVLNAGDWVRIDGDSHSIFLTKITAEGVYFTDGNGTGVYNQVRWDGFYSNAEMSRRFSYKIHLPGNNLIGGDVVHLVNYDSNGGTGSMSGQSVAPGQSFTLSANNFTRSGYTFTGFTVLRSYDNKWYTEDAGWQYKSDIDNNGYHYKIYPEGGKYTLGKAWLGDITTSTMFTFYARWENKHTISYDPNGGSGSMDSETVNSGTDFTIRDSGFTREGWHSAGYNVLRARDNKWYTTDAGWQSLQDIRNNNYHYKVYAVGETFNLNKDWLEDNYDPTEFTFFTQWVPDEATVEFLDNYSGYNYLLGSDLQSNYSNYIVSRDPATYTLSVDSKERLNNQNSLKVVATAAGKSGKDLAMVTSTNYGYSDGYSQVSPMGDNKRMTLRFVAKSSVDGAKMYIRWGYCNKYESVTLSKNWKVYTITLNKTPFYGSALHPYFDKAGTYYLNSLSLADGANTNVVPERGTMAFEPKTYPIGQKLGSLPTPARAGYTFDGWYTASADGGDEYTPETVIESPYIKLYAHWTKDISDTPVRTVESNGHVYELYDNTMSWTDAKAFCEEKGGHLIVINNADENTLAYNMISDRQGYCWIGLNYDTTWQRWGWVNNDPPSYMNWYSPKYGSEDNGSYYAMLYPMNYDTTAYAGKWNKCVGSLYRNSYYGYFNSFFICEYEHVDYLGDADGSGEVDSPDATAILRYQVDIPTGISENTLMLGDVDNSGEVELTDATMIQRYLAEMHTPYHIGERIYRV